MDKRKAAAIEETLNKRQKKESDDGKTSDDVQKTVTNVNQTVQSTVNNTTNTQDQNQPPSNTQPIVDGNNNNTNTIANNNPQDPNQPPSNTQPTVDGNNNNTKETKPEEKKKPFWALYTMLPQTLEEFDQVFEFDPIYQSDKAESSPIAKLKWKKAEFQKWVLQKFNYEMECKSECAIFDTPLVKLSFGYSPQISENGNITNNLRAEVPDKVVQFAEFRKFWFGFEEVVLKYTTRKMLSADPWPIYNLPEEDLASKNVAEIAKALKGKRQLFIHKTKPTKKNKGNNNERYMNIEYGNFKLESMSKDNKLDVKLKVYDGDTNKIIVTSLEYKKHAFSFDAKQMVGRTPILAAGDSAILLFSPDRVSFWTEWGLMCTVKQVKRFQGSYTADLGGEDCNF